MIKESIEKSVLIEFNDSTSGTGFFVQDTYTCYFVSAKHNFVVEVVDTISGDRNFFIKNASGKIKYYPRNVEKNIPNQMTVDFMGLSKDGLSGFGSDFDIIMFEIGKVDYEGYPKILYNKHVKKDNGVSKLNPFLVENLIDFNDVSLGDNVFIFGYPKSMSFRDASQYDFNRPLLRKGTIAGVNNIKNTLIIDCPAYGGNSGSPVVATISNQIGIKSGLVGVVVEYIPAITGYNNVVNSGYSIVEPIHKIREIAVFINKNKRNKKAPSGAPVVP